MPYSVMIWMVDPGAAGAMGDEETAGRPSLPGATAGVTSPPPFTCLSYGIFDSARDTEDLLTSIAETLRHNAPVRVTHGARTFLVPAGRIHYVVCDEVTRPTDEEEG